MNTELHTLPLSSIVLSQTAAQLERRAHLDEAKLNELADSIKAYGLLQPLVARPKRLTDAEAADEDGELLYELVAGERRYLAAQRAGLAEVQVSVKDLTDEQVLEVQLIENLQREDLHELAEAEGYEALQQLGHSVEEIAEKVGKSRATVYSRCKLLALGTGGRAALRSGKISASIALLIARISAPHLQDEALERVLKPYAGAEPMSYRDAVHYIHREFTLRLSEAPFNLMDPGLLPAAGSCVACPKRSGRQPELFADIQGADVCTDIDCFRLKRQAHAAAVVLSARATGKTVIEGDAAARAHMDGYVELDWRCHDDGKGRTYRELLGDGIATALVIDRDSDVTEVIRRADFTKQLKKACAPKEKSKGYEPPPPRKVDKEAERQKKLDQRIYRAIFDASSTVLREAAEFAAADALHAFGYMQDILAALGWDEFNMDEPRKEVAKLSNADLARLLQVIPLCEEIGGYGGTSKRLLEAAKAVKVDAKKIEKQLADQETAAIAPTHAKAKSVKKKSTKKSSAKPK